jgi:hypothetical protein
VDATAAQTLDKGGRHHHRAPGLCPVTPLAAVVEEREHEGEVKGGKPGGALVWRGAAARGARRVWSGPNGVDVWDVFLARVDQPKDQIPSTRQLAHL